MRCVRVVDEEVVVEEVAVAETAAANDDDEEEEEEGVLLLAAQVEEGRGTVLVRDAGRCGGRGCMAVAAAAGVVIEEEEEEDVDEAAPEMLEVEGGRGSLRPVPRPLGLPFPAAAAAAAADDDDDDDDDDDGVSANAPMSPGEVVNDDSSPWSRAGVAGVNGGNRPECIDGGNGKGEFGGRNESVPLFTLVVDIVVAVVVVVVVVNDADDVTVVDAALSLWRRDGISGSTRCALPAMVMLLPPPPPPLLQTLLLLLKLLLLIL